MGARSGKGESKSLTPKEISLEDLDQLQSNRADLGSASDTIVKSKVGSGDFEPEIDDEAPLELEPSELTQVKPESQDIETMMARCPCCRYPLILMMLSTGPGVSCACVHPQRKEPFVDVPITDDPIIPTRRKSPGPSYRGGVGRSA